MGRGLLTGAFSGLVLSGLVLTAVSEFVLPPVRLAVPAAASVEVPPGSEFARPLPETDPVLPAPESAPATDRVGRVTAPEASPAPPSADTASAARPGADTAVPDAPVAPAAGGSAPRLAAAIEPPAPQGAEAVPPAAPEAEALPRADTTVIVPQPAASAEIASAAPMPAMAPSAEAAPRGPAALTEPATGAQPVSPVVPSADVVPAADKSPARPSVPETETAGGAPAADTMPAAPGAVPSAPGAEPAPMAPPVASAPVAPAADTGPGRISQADAGAGPASVPGIPTDLPRATGLPSVSGAPQPGFKMVVPGVKVGVPGVKVGRLPTIGNSETSGQPQTIGEAAPAPAAEAEAPPVRRNAVAFDNPGGRPVFSVILIDDGSPTLDRNALAALSLPVTFAIDPTRPGAAAAAGIYRAGGHEVLILATAIPAGATAQDLAVTFSGYRAALPQAVGVLDVETGGFETNRSLARQVVTILADDGLGLVTYDRGLNAADQIAGTAGVPAARIFRRLDAHDENAATIRRYLDRAAFEAAQQGRVVVVGSTRADTLEGLTDWSGDTRARELALAPVTAALKP